MKETLRKIDKVHHCTRYEIHIGNEHRIDLYPTKHGSLTIFRKFKNDYFNYTIINDVGVLYWVG